MNLRIGIFKAFSLLEVLLAVSILAISTGSIVYTIRGGARVIEQENAKVKAAIMAERLFNELKLNGVREYSISSGVDNGFRWEVKISPCRLDNIAKIEISVFRAKGGGEELFDLVSFLKVNLAEQDMYP